MEPTNPLVSILCGSATQATGREPRVVGAPYPCDLWALQRTFGIPSVVFGPGGGNSHAADEYVVLESLFEFWKSLLLFVLQWCGFTG
jgi:acetylornithine deacetylase